MDNKLGKLTEALEYLHKKFPDADQDVFDNLDAVTDSILIDNIIEAKIADEACSGCDGTHCRLPERMWRGYYVIALNERSPIKLRLNSTVSKDATGTEAIASTVARARSGKKRKEITMTQTDNITNSLELENAMLREKNAQLMQQVEKLKAMVADIAKMV